jgi:hypothetical protein
MKLVFTFLSVALLAAGLPRYSRADLLVSESFNTGGGGYALGSIHGQAVTGTGFQGSWFTTGGSNEVYTVASTGLQFGSLVTSGGSLTRVGDDAATNRAVNVRLNLGQAYAGSTLYHSYLIDAGALGTSQQGGVATMLAPIDGAGTGVITAQRRFRTWPTGNHGSADPTSKGRRQNAAVDYFGNSNETTALSRNPEQLDGNFDLGLDVDGKDFLLWQRNLCTDFDLGGNGNEDLTSAGIVDADDLALWVQQYGNRVDQVAPLSGGTTYLMLSRFTGIGSAATVEAPAEAALFTLTLAQFEHFRATGLNDADLFNAPVGPDSNQVYGRVVQRRTSGAAVTVPADLVMQIPTTLYSRHTIFIDEVRYGDSFAAVTPITSAVGVPEPSTIGILLVGSAFASLIGARCRRK